MSGTPYGCEHLEQFINEENGLKTFQLLHRVFVIGSSKEQRSARMILTCFECVHRDLFFQVCLHCTYFGCGSHIKPHTDETGHTFTMELKYGQLHCSKCKDFIFDVRLDKIARVNSVNGDVIKWPILELLWPYLYKSETDITREMRVMVFSKANRMGLRGLVNLGSTCYMNSVVQVLTHTPILRDYFFTEQHKCEAPQCLITKLFRDFYTGDCSPIVLNDLLYLLWVRVRHLSGHKQQDAHEFLMATLDIFHKHCANSNSLRPFSIINEVYKCSCIIDKAFASTMQTDTVCQNCKSVSTRIDPMWAYSLDLAPSVIDGYTPKSLEDCLRHFTSAETLDQNSKIFCVGCQSLQQSTKQDKIKTLPNVLCFQLKRFQHSKVFTKVSDKINFPENLVMSPFLAKDEVEVKGIPDIEALDDNRYMLFAVVVHKGNELEGGHYISYIRYRDLMWYRCNDTVISEVLIDEVLRSEGYLLFYHKQHLEYH